MNSEKMSTLKDILAKGTYSIQAWDGNIINNNTGHIKNRFIKTGRSKSGQMIVELWHEKKKHSYTVAELVAFEAGMYDKIKEPEKYWACTKGDVRNCGILNIEVRKKTDRLSELHIKKILTTKQLNPYKEKPIGQDFIKDVQEMKQYMTPKQISEVMGYNYNTVKKYYYKIG